MRRLRGALRVLLLLGIVLVMLGKSPGAWACSCAGSTQEERLRFSDLAFTGTVQSQHDPYASPTIRRSNDLIVWSFSIDAVQKGPSIKKAVVLAPRDSESCGYTFKIGGRYRVFANRSPSGYLTTLCSGNVLLSERSPIGVLKPRSTWIVPSFIGIGCLVALVVIRASLSRIRPRTIR